MFMASLFIMVNSKKQLKGLSIQKWTSQVYILTGWNIIKQAKVTKYLLSTCARTC